MRARLCPLDSRPRRPLCRCRMLEDKRETVRRMIRDMKRDQRLTQFSELTRFENIFIELFVVANGKDHLIEAPEKLYIVRRDVAELNNASTVHSKVR